MYLWIALCKSNQAKWKKLSKQRAKKFKPINCNCCCVLRLQATARKKIRENTTSTFSKSIIHFVVNRSHRWKLLSVQFGRNINFWLFVAPTACNQILQPASCYVSFDEFLSGFIVNITRSFHCKHFWYFIREIITEYQIYA